MIRYKQ